MDDVIYRQAAIDNMAMVIWGYPNEIYPQLNDYSMAVELAKDGLMGLPSAQKKGHWRNYEGTLTCSVCETEIDNGIMEYCCDDVPMFCPYCGADMRGEADEENS